MDKNSNSKGRFLTATNILILVNIVVYILDKYLLIWEGGMFESPGIVERILGFCGGDVYMSLCYYDGCIVDGEIWRCVSFLFAHLFILHLVVNMIGFYIAGNQVEKRYGPIFVVIVFLVIGILNIFATNALPFLETADSVTGGSSGAVFGFMGIAAAHWILDKSSRHEYSKLKRVFLIIYGIIFTYFMGDWTMFCHNIGFVMGLILGFILVMIQKRRDNMGAKQDG